MSWVMTNDVIIGGPHDSRLPSLWTPDDGLAHYGKRRPRQCCAQSKGRASKSREGERARCGNVALAGERYCRRHIDQKLQDHEPDERLPRKHRDGARERAVRRPTGRWGQWLLGRLREDFEALREDPELLDGADSVAAVDVLIGDIATRGLADGDTPHFRRRALMLFERAIRSQKAGRPKEAARFFTDLGNLLRKGAERDATIEQLIKLEEQRSRMASQALSTRAQVANSYTAAQLLALFTGIQDIAFETLPAQQAEAFVGEVRVRMIGEDPTLSEEQLALASGEDEA